MIGSVCYGHEQACAWRIEGFFFSHLPHRRLKFQPYLQWSLPSMSCVFSYHQEPQKSHVVLHSKPAISTKGLDAMSPLLLSHILFWLHRKAMLNNNKEPCHQLIHRALFMGCANNFFSFYRGSTWMSSLTSKETPLVESSVIVSLITRWKPRSIPVIVPK